MRKHETAVCGTARTVVWEVGKCENRRQMPFMISIYLLPNSCQLFIIFRLPSVKASRFKCNVDGLAGGERRV